MKKVQIFLLERRRNDNEKKVISLRGSTGSLTNLIPRGGDLFKSKWGLNISEIYRCLFCHFLIGTEQQISINHMEVDQFFYHFPTFSAHSWVTKGAKRRKRQTMRQCYLI